MVPKTRWCPPRSRANLQRSDPTCASISSRRDTSLPTYCPACGKRPAGSWTALSDEHLLRLLMIARPPCGTLIMRKLYSHYVGHAVRLAPADRTACERLVHTNFDQCAARYRQRRPQTHPTSGAVEYARMHERPWSPTRRLERRISIGLEPELPPSFSICGRARYVFSRHGGCKILRLDSSVSYGVHARNKTSDTKWLGTAS